MQHISIRKVQLLINIHHFMDSPWLELLRKKHGTDVHDCFEGTAMEHFAKHYFCGLLKFAMLWALNNMDNFWNLNFRESKIKVFASPSCELVRKSNINQCSSSHLIARASMTMQEQNYRIVLPPARGPMVSMCHLKCVGPYSVHVSPKMCGTLWCPCVT